MDNLDQEEALKRPRRMMLWMRLGYITALSLMFLMVGFSYFERTKNEERISNIINLYGQFNAIGDQLDVLYDHFNVLLDIYSPKAIDPRTEGLNINARKDFYLTAGPESQIKVPLEQAINYSNDIMGDVGNFDLNWNAISDEFRMEFLKNFGFQGLENPIDDIRDVIENPLLYKAKTEAGLHAVSKNFVRRYDRVLGPQIKNAEGFMKQYLSGLISRETEEQNRFLLASIAVIFLLGGLVFVPLDIMMRRMFLRLVEKTTEANEAVVKAKAADKAKSEFLATMSHEIRTPMNGVLGMAELLARTQLDQRQKTFADIILKSGNALLTIINDILDFSKIEAEQLNLVDAPFNLIESIEDVSTLMSSKAAEKDVELLVHIDQSIPKCLSGDSGRLRQILTNLVGNAVKFTDHGHVLVRTRCELGQNDDGQDVATIKFEIEDTGIGIPEDQIVHIFDKFSQVDGSTTRKHEGTGLGLAISARLVGLMGGKLGASSVIGKGSVFKFSVQFPLAQSDEMQANNEALQVSSARILIIDDNKVNRTILTEYCDSWNFESAAVESGMIGLKFLEYAKSKAHSAVDLVILDFHMPGMNGAEVLRAIRNNPIISKTPVLVLSSVDQAKELAQFEGYELDGILSKPARSQLLLKTINSILNKARSSHLGEPISQQHDAPAPPDLEAKQEDSGQNNQSGLTESLNVVEKLNSVPGKSAVPILVAEDNPVNQIVFSEALKQLNIDFEIASDGLEAVELWQKLRPEVIIMDVSMPNMNGHEASREIRRIEEANGLCRTPIIAVTAHAQKSDCEDCIEAGMDDYMTKPISPDMLNQKIIKWIDQNDQQMA